MVRVRAWRIAFFADLIFGMARKVDGKLRRVKTIHIFGRHLPESNTISFEFLVWAPVLLFSMVAHEYAHAEAAYRQGDDTAYMLGRLTFNPLKHIDPLMTVIVPFLLWRIGAPPFGAAKPVPVNPRKYRQFRRGGIIVSLAGGAVHLGLFVVCTLLFALVGGLGGAGPALPAPPQLVRRMVG